MKSHAVRVFYCPRCDRPFYDIKSNVEGAAQMERHVKKAHPKYYKIHFKED